MYTKQEIIIRSHREGKSHRQISRELQINHKTIKKYIEEYENLQKWFDRCYNLTRKADNPGLLLLL